MAEGVFQECMPRILLDIECIIIYMDDIIIIGLGTLAEHLKDMEKVLIRLQEYGMQVYPAKSSWAKDQLEYLGFTIFRSEIKPQQKKIEAILRISALNNQKQVRQSLGIINYYKDMWKKRAHILAPLSELTGKTKKKFVWE
eukprot:15330586-Ditylum_brightwellii.AAC.1